MDTNELMELARECGLESVAQDRRLIVVKHSNGTWVSVNSRLSKFAELVESRAKAKEREACAKVCDNTEQAYYSDGTQRKLNYACADAIRAMKD